MIFKAEQFPLVGRGFPRVPKKGTNKEKKTGKKVPEKFTNKEENQRKKRVPKKGTCKEREVKS